MTVKGLGLNAGGSDLSTETAVALWLSSDGATWSRVAHDEAVFADRDSQPMSSVIAGVRARRGRRSWRQGSAAVWTSDQPLTRSWWNPLLTGHHVGVDLTEMDMAHDSDEEWMSIDTAGQMLGVSSWTVRFRLERGDLLIAENSAGELGITRASVADEQQWQATASFGRRTRRGTRYAASWLLEAFTH